MPATFIKFANGEFIIKSPVLPTARKPQKEVITLLNGIPSTSSAASFITFSKPLAVVFRSSLSVISSDVGPRRRFPSTVGEIRIPFPIFDGVRKTVVFTSEPHSLSRRIYSPRRGCTENELSPVIAAILSEYSPAAFITYLVLTVSPEDITSYPSSVFLISVTSKSSFKSAPLSIAFPIAATVSS